VFLTWITALAQLTAPAVACLGHGSLDSTGWHKALESAWHQCPLLSTSPRQSLTNVHVHTQEEQSHMKRTSRTRRTVIGHSLAYDLFFFHSGRIISYRIKQLLWCSCKRASWTPDDRRTWCSAQLCRHKLFLETM